MWTGKHTRGSCCRMARGSSSLGLLDTPDAIMAEPVTLWQLVRVERRIAAGEVVGGRTAIAAEQHVAAGLTDRAELVVILAPLCLPLVVGILAFPPSCGVNDKKVGTTK